jgi:hypothetical protein
MNIRKILVGGALAAATVAVPLAMAGSANASVDRVTGADCAVIPVHGTVTTETFTAIQPAGQFDQFNNILHVIAFSLRKIILVGFLVYVHKEDLFVHLEINIDHAGGTSFSTIPEGETHLTDSAGAFHHRTDLLTAICISIARSCELFYHADKRDAPGGAPA